MPELWLGRVRLKQLALGTAVITNPARFDSPERSETMRLGGSIQYVQHRKIGGRRCVRNQEPVTPPGNRFGAHDYRRLQPRQTKKVIQRVVELPSFHVVGVGPEARVPPLGVVRVASPAPAPTERRKVRIPPAGVDQRSLETRTGKVRVSRRNGKGANIDEMCRAFSCKQPQKLLDRPGRMPDREKPSGGHAPRSCRLRRVASPREE